MMMYHTYIYVCIFVIDTLLHNCDYMYNFLSEK